MSPAQCSQCHFEFGANPNSEICPRCGQSSAPDNNVGHNSRARGLKIVSGYFGFLSKVLFQPAQTYRTLGAFGGFTHPLCVALVTHWIAAWIGVLWKGAIYKWIERFEEFGFSFFEDVVEIEKVGGSHNLRNLFGSLKNWMWGTASLLADPFTTLIYILFVSLLVFIGARIFVTPSNEGSPKVIRFESSVRVVCYGMVPTVLNAIPILGSVLAPWFVAIYTTIAAREIYRISNTRAFLVGMFPFVLILIALAATIAFVGVFLFQWVSRFLFSA